MKKPVVRDAQTGRFVIGRTSAERFSAVEGQDRSARTGQLIDDADRNGETGEAHRQRIRSAFKAK
ncbi:MAG: hypothetical protein ABI398_09180 [Devosia sp.]